MLVLRKQDYNPKDFFDEFFFLMCNLFYESPVVGFHDGIW